jgi:mono/diheme cytochrome c family protein
MKNRKMLAVMVLSMSLILLFGFNFYKTDNAEINSDSGYTMNDSTLTNNRGSMNGHGMMSGGMMGRGMMSGRMMGQGMMSSAMMGSSIGNSSGNTGWVAPASANNLTNPLKNIAKASREGRNIFETQCFTCHGSNGNGDGPVAVSLNPKPANLTSSKVQEQSDSAIFWKITNGNAPMPSFKHTLSETQRWALVDYLRTLAK